MISHVIEKQMTFFFVTIVFNIRGIQDRQLLQFLFLSSNPGLYTLTMISIEF